MEAALDAAAPLVAVLATPEAASEARVAALLERAGGRASVVPAREMARISDARTSQGVAAVAESIVFDFGPEHDAAGADTVLVLDGVQDPGNVGTIVRTAAWFNIGLVIAGAGTADLESPKVVRAATGGLWDVRLLRARDVSVALDSLLEEDFALFGADMEGSPAHEWRPRGRVALVLGSEAHGLSDAARARLRGTVAIRRAGAGAGAESLNVAVAAGILLHEWRAGAANG